MSAATAGTAGTATPAGPARPSRLVGLLRRRETGVALACVLVVVVATAVNPQFATGSDGFRNLLLTPALLMVLAVAQAVVVVARNIDLSVSAVLGIVAYAVGRLFTDWDGAPVVVVCLLGVLLGAALGAVNGLLVSLARVPSLVITLGTLYVIRGVDVAWAGADRINAGDLPAAFTAIGTSSVLSVPWLTVVAVLVVAVAAWVLATRRGGRELYAIGSDPGAAELYGLPVRRRVFVAFLLSGTLAGLAGVMYAARYATVSSTAGTGLELQAVAAAVIGGVAIAGGSGTVVGAALGAVLLTTINRALPSLGIQDFWQQAVVGALILGAIVLDRVLHLRTQRRLQAASGHRTADAPAPAAPTTPAGARA